VQAVAKPISTATGLPGSDVENMLGSGMLLAGAKAQPYVNRAGQAVGQAMYAAEPYVTGAAKAPVSAPLQFGKGLVEGLANKQYNPATSAMVPLRDTYTPPAAAQRFMGELPGVPRQTLSQLESQARPTSELVGGRTGQLAQAISPKTTAGETLVPLQGQGMQAFGERVGRGVRTNPLQAMGEIGLTALTGIPFKTLAQGVGELGARYLGNKTGFAPGFTNQVGAAQAQAALQPTQPRLGYTPTAAGPVAPPTMYTGAGGASADLAAAGQAALNTKYPPMPAATAPAASTSISQTPQQMAAARIQPGLDPARQAALDTVQAQIRARGETEKAARVAALQSRAAAAGGYTPPRVEAPVAPVAPTAMPTAAPAPAAPVNTLDTLRGRLTPMTAEQQAAVDAYNAKPPVEKAAQTRAETAAKTVATTPAPVVKSTMTPTEKRISFNELAKDVEGAKEFGIVHDIKNKTRTEPGNSPDTMPSDMRGVLPKNTTWEKSVEHWNPDGTDVAFTEYYTAKTTKNSPVYKYVEPETGDGVLYKQGTGNNWTKVDSMEFPVPKGVLKATEGRAAVQAALDSGEPATIKYKTSTGIITENVNRSINFKPDADLALTHRIDRPDHSNTLFGTEKSSGKPIKVEITDLSARENNPEYIKVFDNSNPKSPVLIKTYDLNGTLTSKQRNKLKKD
jgi:hypothetical protein